MFGTPRHSFLPPEERQMFKAEVIYRLEEPNGFSKLMSKTIRTGKKNPAIGPGDGRDDDPLERFDMSGFCSSEQHAETFARYASDFASWSRTPSSSNPRRSLAAT